MNDAEHKNLMEQQLAKHVKGKTYRYNNGKFYRCGRYHFREGNPVAKFVLGGGLGEIGMTTKQIADRLEIPLMNVRSMIADLRQHHIIKENGKHARDIVWLLSKLASEYRIELIKPANKPYKKHNNPQPVEKPEPKPAASEPKMVVAIVKDLVSRGYLTHEDAFEYLGSLMQ